MVSDLQRQNYPQFLYSVFVVADHCDDSTAKIAREKGAWVFERNRGGRGKGHVIKFFLEKLLNDLKEGDFDAVCFFDADNRVHPDFLAKMNSALCEGKEFVQGYLGVKNPLANWVTRAISGSYLITNRLWQASKESLGISASCGGTGFCITTKLLEKHGWPAETLTEDFEMEIYYTLKGNRVYWAHDAIVYDEKPSSWRIALKQRTRWLVGHLNVLKKYYVKLLVKGVKRGDVRLLDKVFYMISPLYLGGHRFPYICVGLRIHLSHKDSSP